ncbi:MAG: hypothetical protein RL885_02070 [Planctomycetota bacterium]
MRSRLNTASWILLTVAVLLGGIAAASASPDSEELRLSDGSILFVDILDSNDQSLRVRRLDTGGVLTLYWDHLAEIEAKRLRRELGYDIDEGEEILVDAVRVRFLTGQDRVGVIVEETPTTITLVDDGSTLPFQRSTIREVEPVRVPANEVYKIEDLYREKLSEIDPTSAADHVELAGYLRKLDAWDLAKTHLLRAQEIDSGYETETVANLLETIQPFVENKRFLDQVDAQMDLARRTDYQKAIQGLKDLLPKAPSPALGKNVEEKIQTLQEREQTYVSNYVERKWWDTVKDLIDERVGDRLLTNKEAQSWATKSLGDEAAAELAETLGVTPERVREAWKNRTRSKIEQANYTSGTFILGDKALVIYDDDGNAKQGAEARRALAGGGGSSESFQRRLQDYFQSTGRQASNAQRDRGNDPEIWWNEQKSSIRSQWLRAYYAEFGGDMKMVRAQFNYSRDTSPTRDDEEEQRRQQQQRQQQGRRQNRGDDGNSRGIRGQGDKISVEQLRLERKVYFR